MLNRSFDKVFLFYIEIHPSTFAMELRRIMITQADARYFRKK